MSEYNTIWVTGTPRTGSMWTTNVIREILRHNDFVTQPKNQLQHDRDWLRLYSEHAITDQNHQNRYVIKTHQVINPGLPKSRYVTNVRNPYDICASFYQFMKSDVDTAISVALSHRSVIAHYKRFDPASVNFVQYDRIENQPVEVIRNLAQFLDLAIDEEDCSLIQAKFSREKIAKKIESNDSVLNQKIRKKEAINANEIVRLSSTNFRSFDPETGFQSGHISSRKSGEWRHLFSSREILKILEALDDAAVQLGYRSEKNSPA